MNQFATMMPAAEAVLDAVRWEAFDYGWGQSVAGLCDFLTPHLYGYALWKSSVDGGRIKLDFRTWYLAYVDRYLSDVAIFNSPKPVLSSEVVWGAVRPERAMQSGAYLPAFADA